jgi:hypothetical protein
MANRNTQGFGLIAAGVMGQTPATSGQGNYFIEAAYGTDIFNGQPVKMASGYITDGTASDTTATIGVFNGMFYNAATTLKPTWANWYNQPITPANSENLTAFVLDNPFQLYVAAADAAVPQAQFGKAFGCTTVAAVPGNEQSGTSKAALDYANRHENTHQWRLLRSAEDPENSDTTAAYGSYIVVQNLNQVINGSGVTW